MCCYEIFKKEHYLMYFFIQRTSFVDIKHGSQLRNNHIKDKIEELITSIKPIITFNHFTITTVHKSPKPINKNRQQCRAVQHGARAEAGRPRPRPTLTPPPPRSRGCDVVFFGLFTKKHQHDVHSSTCAVLCRNLDVGMYS